MNMTSTSRLASWGILLAGALSALQACSESDEPASVNGNADAGNGKTEAGNTSDAAGGAAGQGGQPADASKDGATNPESSTPDATKDSPSDTQQPNEASVEPGAGELGGVCDGQGKCSEGECTQLPSKDTKRCTKSCVSNYNCPDILRCEAASADSAFCLWGPRGTGEIGAPCGDGKKGLGCKSGLCVDADPEQAIATDTCTDTCESGPTCGVPFPVCIDVMSVGKLCLGIVAGDVGGRCSYEGTCEGDAVCQSIPNLGDRCTVTCSPGDDCGKPYLECRQVEGGSFCLMKNPS